MSVEIKKENKSAEKLSSLVYLKCIEPRKKKQRFYSLQIQPDLWGGVNLVREYGRLGQPGKVMSRWFNAESKAIDNLNKLHQQKLKRGYQ